MPPGTIRSKPSARVLEKFTAQACIAIAQRVAQTRKMADDELGASAADQVVQLIKEELLGPGQQQGG